MTAEHVFVVERPKIHLNCLPNPLFQEMSSPSFHFSFTSKLAWLLILIACSLVSNAQSELSVSDRQVIGEFKDAVRRHDVDWIAEHCYYPLKRAFPLPDIVSASEMKARYDSIFDDSLSKAIVASEIDPDWSIVGWRGIMFANGMLWIDQSGELISVNRHSPVERAKRRELILEDRNGLHPTLREYIEPVCSLETEFWRIRIDEVSSGSYRAVGWAKRYGNETLPGLILHQGELIPDGTGGNHYYEWKQGPVVYRCSMIVMGEEGSPDAVIEVEEGAKPVFECDASLWK